MHIAITGASGFIGSHLVKALATRGHTVQLLLRSEFETTDSYQDLKKIHFALNAFPDDIFEKAGRPDALVHLAWGGLPHYRSISHFEDELPMHFGFLKRMIESGLKKLIVTGTCFEYGAVSGCVSETQASNPTNPYGYAKDALRRQLEFLQRSQKFELSWTRLFYLYGHGQSCGSLLPLLEAAIKRGDKTFPMSLGEQLRDYLPVTDVAERLASLVDVIPGAGILNLCSGEPVSVRRLVEEKIKELGSEITPVFGALPYSDFEPMAFWGCRKKWDSFCKL